MVVAAKQSTVRWPARPHLLQSALFARYSSSSSFGVSFVASLGVLHCLPFSWDSDLEYDGFGVLDAGFPALPCLAFLSNRPCLFDRSSLFRSDRFLSFWGLDCW